jgi:hypothetical protein
VSRERPDGILRAAPYYPPARPGGPQRTGFAAVPKQPINWAHICDLENTTRPSIVPDGRATIQSARGRELSDA